VVVKGDGGMYDYCAGWGSTSVLTRPYVGGHGAGHNTYGMSGGVETGFRCTYLVGSVANAGYFGRKGVGEGGVTAGEDIAPDDCRPAAIDLGATYTELESTERGSLCRPV
jgi:hypothetical protein